MTLTLNKIYLGDCLALMKAWSVGCVDLIITSPPYNLGDNHHTSTKKTQIYDDNLPEKEYQDMQVEVLNECLRVCKGDMFYNHQHRFRQGALIRPCSWISRSGWILKQEIVWSRGSPNMDKCRFFPFTERIYWLTKPESATKFENKLGLTDDWHISPVGASGEHTRQFPVQLPQKIIACTDSKIILDPYMGAGTTAVAAMTLDRNWVGCERDKKFIALAEARIDAELRQGKMF